MSFNNNYRKFQTMSAAVAFAEIEDEGRNGECGTTWPTFLAASMHYAEARDFVGRCLGFNPADPRTNQTLEQIRRLVSTLPEEGDQAQPEADGPEEGDQA